MRRLALLALLAMLFPTIDRAACALNCAAAAIELRTQTTAAVDCHDDTAMPPGVGAVEPSCHGSQAAALTAAAGAKPVTSTLALLAPAIESAGGGIVQHEHGRAGPPTSGSVRASFLPPLRI